MKNFNIKRLLQTKTLLLPLLITTFSYASDDVRKEIDELKLQAQKILNRVNYLEQKLEVKVDRKEIETIKVEAKEAKAKASEQKGFLELKNKKTTLTIGGRIDFRTVYNSVSKGVNSGSDTNFALINVPLDDVGESKQVNISGRGSRIWLQTKTPTDYGILYSLIDTDFLGEMGSERVVTPHKPRLRHAYIELGGLTLGQTFTTFMGVGNADLIEDPVDIVHVRQPVIRWSEELKNGKFQIALESPETTLNDKDANRVSADDDRLPDLVAKYERYGSWGAMSLSGMLRQLRSDSTVKESVSDEEIGGAIHFAGKIKTIKHDNLRFGFSYGNALGRYISWNSFNSGNIDEDGEISLNDMYGGHIAYQHWWSDKLRSSLVYGRVESDNDLNIVSDSVTKMGESYNVNLLWTPIENTQVGVEFMHVKRELESGESGDLNRFYFNARYDF